MRSAERILAMGCAAAVFAALSGCATIENTLGLSTPSAATAQAAPATGAKAVSAGDATKAAAKLDPAKADAANKPPARPIPADTQRTYDVARQAMVAGRTAEAERGFTALTRSDPDLSGPYANLGLIHRNAGRTAEATVALQKAVSLSPQSAELHNQLGVAYRMAGSFDKAKASYEQAIALDPNYAPAVLNLGILYDLYLWDGARALELYDRYLQLTPAGDDQVKRWVTDLRNRTARKDAPSPRKEQG